MKRFWSSSIPWWPTVAIVSMCVGMAVTLDSCRPADAQPANQANQQLVERFIQAIERNDSTAAYALIDNSAVTSIRMTFSGLPDPNPVYQGKPASVAYLRGLFGTFTQLRFANPVLNASTDNRTVFFEATGDFRTRQGNISYRNVYVLKFSIENGRITALQEYLNPVAIFRTFGQPPLGQ